MKAAVLYGPEDIRVEDIPEVTVSRGEIVVSIKAAAICGTDIRIYKKGPDGNVPEMAVLGHEIAGDVISMGPEVEGFSPGMRVAIAPNFGCGRCRMCIRGDEHLCSQYRALGIDLPGGFAEKVRIPAPAVSRGNVVGIPEGVSYEEAALNEPLSCCLNGQEACGIRAGHSVAIIGAGTIGLMHMMLAQAVGAGPVLVADVLDERVSLAGERGADVAMNSAETDIVEAVMDLTGGIGMDAVIVACPSPEAQKGALRLAATGGYINFFGGLPRGSPGVTLDTNEIHYRQLVVTGSTRASKRQYRTTLHLIATGKVNVGDLVTSVVDLDDIELAMTDAAAGRGLKTVVKSQTDREGVI
ncbi:MAG: Sorbitol dehydrogenase [Chloroflexi bacterium]|nr:Sorbitol dehydrogenase [Chloroflexota bacterium]